MEKINLIWQTSEGDQTQFEFEYTTKLLFNQFEQNKIFDYGSLSTVMDNSVIIYSNNTNSVSNEFINYLDKFLEKGYKFYLLHFSNEDLNHNCEYYSKANHVFRNYYDSNIKLDNVTFIPLGVKSGFLSEEDNFQIQNSKKYNLSFIGQPKSDREELLHVMERIESCFIHKTNSWNCSTSLSQKECIEIYKSTKFVPCPKGWVHPDSFRLMECLESGSIPILKNYDNLYYFKNIWGETPIPVVDSWEEVSNITNMTNEEYEQLYDKVGSWYSKFRIQLPEKIKNTILGK